MRVCMRCNLEIAVNESKPSATRPCCGWVWSKNLIAYSLRPISWLFCAIVAVRRFAYLWGLFKARKVDCPIVIVGNISVGGTGKTPLMIWLSGWLQEQGVSVGIITKAYAGQLTKDQVVCSNEEGFERAGDEALLLAQRCAVPVAAGYNRFHSAQALLQRFPTVNLILCDDGLQHYKLHRDREIVIQHQQAYGNGWCLPAGPLREPLSRLKRCDLVIQRERDIDEKLGITWQLCNPGNTRPLSDWQNRPVQALAGIGFPQRFFTLLQEQGVRAKTWPFPDHHDYVETDLPIGNDSILVTHKDAVKLQRFNDPRIWVVELEFAAKVTLKTQLSALLEGLIDGQTSA